MIDLKDFLEEKYNYYNNPRFIEDDPVSIPHQFTRTEDIEISAFLASTIAWGQRKTIIKNANQLIQLMDFSPFDFVVNANEKELERFKKFKHRTFNGVDAASFITSLQNIYRNHQGLKSLFYKSYRESGSIKDSIVKVRDVFFEVPHEVRTEKHFANILKKASAKRLNMFLRWMVRKDGRGVDFGIWDNIETKELFLPLDVHTGNVARKLGLLTRNQNDWLAVEEITNKLKDFDRKDPVKYDFALFGLGAYEKF